MTLLSRLGMLVDTCTGASQQRAFREGWPARTSSEIGFFSTEKVQYRYRRRAPQQSDAPTLVFTADPPITLEVYDELLDIFTQRFDVVVVELPAMGFSATSPSFRFGFREMNDDLAIFLREVAGKGAIWAFTCAAGLAAVDLATRHPELVSRLILLQTADVAAFQKWKAARDPKGILARPIIGQMVMKRMAHKRMPSWYRLSVGNHEKLAHFCSCAETSFAHGALWSLASAYQNYMDPHVELAELKRPILSLWGRADRSHPTGNETSAVSFSSDVKQVTFDDLGHFSELEAPERVFKVICQHIDTGI